MLLPTTKPTYLENIIAVRVEDHDALVEVVMFHRAGGVQNREWRFRLRLKRIVRPSVVQVVAKTRHQQPQNLEVAHEPLHFPRFEHREHGLGHVESVSPVVVFDRTVVLPHAQNPATKHLHR